LCAVFIYLFNYVNYIYLVLISQDLMIMFVLFLPCLCWRGWRGAAMGYLCTSSALRVSSRVSSVKGKLWRA